MTKPSVSELAWTMEVCDNMYTTIHPYKMIIHLYKVVMPGVYTAPLELRMMCDDTRTLENKSFLYHSLIAWKAVWCGAYSFTVLWDNLNCYNSLAWYFNFKTLFQIWGIDIHAQFLALHLQYRRSCMFPLLQNQFLFPSSRTVSVHYAACFYGKRAIVSKGWRSLLTVANAGLILQFSVGLDMKLVEWVNTKPFLRLS